MIQYTVYFYHTMTMQRILLNIRYLGADFCGWQKQPNGLPTIQAALENAVAQIADFSYTLISLFNHPYEIACFTRHQ